MDRFASGYPRTVDTDIYEYCGDDFLPIDIDALGPEGMLFHPQAASSDSDQLSLQGTGSRQSSLRNFNRTSSHQSSLRSSFQGVDVSAVFLCQSQNIDWLMAQEQGRQPFRWSVAQHLPAYWVNVCLLSCIQIHY